MGRWMRTYHRAVLGGEISVAGAVEEYLCS